MPIEAWVSKRRNSIWSGVASKIEKSLIRYTPNRAAKNVRQNTQAERIRCLDVRSWSVGSLAELRIASRSFGVRIQLFRYEPEPYETIGLELQNPRGTIRLMHTIGIHFNCLLNKHQMAYVTKMPKFVDHETLMWLIKNNLRANLDLRRTKKACEKNADERHEVDINKLLLA